MIHSAPTVYVVHNAQIPLQIGVLVFITSKLHQEKKIMEFPYFDPNAKLAVVSYNGENHPICLWFATKSPSPGWRTSWIKSTVNSTTETQGGWSVLNIDVHCPTQPDHFSSTGWNSKTITTWEPCSLSLLSIVLEDRSSWTLRWLDLLNKFWKVCTGPKLQRDQGSAGETRGWRS